MRRREFLVAGGISLVAGAALAQSGNKLKQTAPVSAGVAGWLPPSDEAIRSLLQSRIEAQHQGVGLVVGLLTPDRRTLVASGRAVAGKDQPVDGNSLFEMHSVTKTFTALLLSQTALKGELKLDDPVEKHLKGWTIPSVNGQPIRLIDLATHTSGLPTSPGNLKQRPDGTGPMDYTNEDLKAFLASFTPQTASGSHWIYSNVGYGLLGEALAAAAGKPYAVLLHERVLAPLGMVSSSIEPAPSWSRLAAGHDPFSRPLNNPPLHGLEGAWALRASGDDMLRYLSAYLTPKSKLANAAALTLKTANGGYAMAWEQTQTPDGVVYSKEGGGRGYRSWIGFRPATRSAVVVLANLGNREGGDDIGFNVLTGSPVLTLTPPVSPDAGKVEVNVPVAVLARHVGRYSLAPGMVAEITLVDGKLFGVLGSAPPAQLYATGPNDFFLRTMRADVHFIQDDTGATTAVIFKTGGREMRGERIKT